MNRLCKLLRAEKLPDNYFYVQMNLLKIFGLDLWGTASILHNIYSLSVFILLWTIFLVMAFTEIVVQRHDINIIIGISNYVISTTAGYFKLIMLFINRKKIARMLESLHEPPFAPDEFRGGKEEERLLKALVRKTNFQNIIYYSSISGTLLMGLVNTLYYRIKYSDDPSKWILPFVPTMPWFDYSTSPKYELAVLFETSGTYYQGIQIANAYSMLTCVLAHISVQLIILGNAFRNLRSRAVKLQERENDASKPFEYYINQIFRETWKHHLQTYELAAEMERLCSLIILFIMLSSIMLMCFVMYSCLLFPLFSFAFMQNIFYCCIVICHVGMYSYWGSEVSDAALGVAQAAGEANWPGLPKKISRSLIMVMVRAQKPLYITAGKFFPLSNATFMSIMKGSVSFFMLLRRRKLDMED